MDAQTDKQMDGRKKKRKKETKKLSEKESKGKTSRTEFGQQMRSLANCPRTCL